VADNRLVRLDGAVSDTVARNYSAVWRDLGSVDGHLYGVWFKAANKSLIWYNVGLFERFGMVPPTDVDALLKGAARLSSAGVPAFAIGGKDGWTLTDWFENLFLRVAGADRYDRLATHRLSWTDESVKTTLRLLAALLDPNLVAGGAGGALGTSYEDSVRQVFAEPPSAAMVFEGDFVAGVIDAKTPAALGVTADVFAFPPIGASGPVVVGGGDAAVLTKESPAGVALLRYLASPSAAAIWARRGGFISPNWNVDLSVYPDPITRMIVRSLVDAGDDFRFDLSDLQPAAFGATPDGGIRKLLQEFIADPDVDRTASRLEAAATAAFAP
jgi:ABC-type glycerol-3-phosphate transport system substrate-binding protein